MLLCIPAAGNINITFKVRNMKSHGKSSLTRSMRIPSLGSSVVDVLSRWKNSPLGFCASRGTLLPAALNVYNGLEYFYTGLDRNVLNIRLCSGLCRPATIIESNELVEALSEGAVEIYMRGTEDGYADRRSPYICLHQSTAKKIPLRGAK